MNAERIRESTDLWTREPEKALGQPTVTARDDATQAVLQAGAFSHYTAVSIL